MRRIRPYRYQTFWLRFWAGIIDGLVFMPLSIFNDFVAYPILGAGLGSGLWYVFHSFAFLAYSVLLHGFYGQTIGKLATGVKVLDVTEQPLSLKQAFLRDSVPILCVGIGVLMDLPKALSGVNPLDQKVPGTPELLIGFAAMGWFAAEIITMLLNNKRRALHDFIAGSVVIRVGQEIVLTGVLIGGFRTESRAREAGLQKGDVIIEYGGVGDLTTDRLAALAAGRRRQSISTRVVIVRDGQHLSVRLPGGSLGILAMDTAVQGSFEKAQGYQVEPQVGV